MKRPSTTNFLSSFVFLLLAVGIAASQTQLYRIRQMRAAPGELLNVIELLKEDMINHKKYGINKPYLMRHSQGDQWDLMLIYPVSSISDELSADSQKARAGSKTFDKSYGDAFFAKISWHQDGFVNGPSAAEFSRMFETYSYYHVEIFTSLSGKQTELFNQRKMENAYLNEIKRRPNHIYTRSFGPSWDIFTIGFYKDVKDYASSADISAELKAKAAKKAGFESINTIGSYLRELILEHHDTLAGAVRAN
jgi:hypothetical protein